MTDSYHFQIEPEPRAELNCGEFVLTADGGLHRRTHWDHLVTLSAADVNWYGWRDAEALARHLESQEYKRRDSIVFPSGATLKVAGDKITGRIAPEPIRPALDWDTATPFDPFGADFIVTKGEVPTAPLHTSPTTDSAYPAIAGLLRG